MKAVYRSSTIYSLREGPSQPIPDVLTANTGRAIQQGGLGLLYFVAINALGEKQALFAFNHLGIVMDSLGLERSTPESLQDERRKTMMGIE